MDLALIRLLILDVDGVLTDGRLVITADAAVGQAFHVQDGCAIKLWRRCGGKAAILSGRDCVGVTNRVKELGVEWVRLGVTDKLAGYQELLGATDCGDDRVAYMGDDLPDLRPMSRCGFPVAVADAAPAVKRASRYVTRRPGGRGAVAEVVELLLRRQHRWAEAIHQEL